MRFKNGWEHMRVFFGLIGGIASLLGCAAGCAVATSSSEPLGRDAAAVCSMPDATTIAVAELAVTVGFELHRWELLTDFQLYTGYGNRQMLGLSAAGLAQCGGSCPNTAALLTLQDQRTDQTVVLGGSFLGAAAFASSLTSGFTNQRICTANGSCPYEAHALNIEFETPRTCGDVDTFLVTAPGGGNLANPANLNNALYWTANNGPNPLIDFHSTATSVSIDPSGQLYDPPFPADIAYCSVISPDVNLAGTPCVCATGGVTSGVLLNDRSLTRNTYYCRATWGCSQNSSINIAGQTCTCPDWRILVGNLQNDRLLTRNTYYCRASGDRCQQSSDVNINGQECTCAAQNVTAGHFTNSGSQNSNLYYCR